MIKFVDFIQKEGLLDQVPHADQKFLDPYWDPTAVVQSTEWYVNILKGIGLDGFRYS